MKRKDALKGHRAHISRKLLKLNQEIKSLRVRETKEEIFIIVHVQNDNPVQMAFCFLVKERPKGLV